LSARNRIVLLALFVSLVTTGHPSNAQSSSAHPSNSPVSIVVNDRTRVDAWNWFAAPPKNETYGYVESLLRISIAQRIHKWDWSLEIAQPAVLGLPDNAVSPVTAQGQLGLGGTYYASNGNNTEPAAAFFKQGYARYHFDGTDRSLRIGRVEFVEGQETKPENPTLAWVQTNRIANRLLGNFAFSNAQRSFDGIDAHYGARSWDVTGFAARADQGVFNMNGNPELNVDAQYLAFTKSDFGGHVLWRAFGMGYHDGRTGLTKTDNRALAIRSGDHNNIRIGTYGGDVAAAVPAGPGQFDFLFWVAGQNGSWGKLDHSANAEAVEGGYQFSKTPRSPWVRAGWFRGSGDSNPTDGTHNTFFQVLPTPRVYARDPFYNLMNNTDEFIQVMDKPTRKLALRSDLHWLQLTSGKDLWYQGGGAFDNKVFGYTGRPSNGANSFATVYDISADYQMTKTVGLNFYYAHIWGKTVIGRIYPTGSNSNYGYLEFVYHWGVDQRKAGK
jgi:hypothetical protein